MELQMLSDQLQSMNPYCAQHVLMMLS
ncbi:hypothetical protein ACHAXH_001605 [Discostella pseudostelligera]